MREQKTPFELDFGGIPSVSGPALQEALDRDAIARRELERLVLLEQTKRQIYSAVVVGGVLLVSLFGYYCFVSFSNPRLPGTSAMLAIASFGLAIFIAVSKGMVGYLSGEDQTVSKEPSKLASDVRRLTLEIDRLKLESQSKGPITNDVRERLEESLRKELIETGAASVIDRVEQELESTKAELLREREAENRWDASRTRIRAEITRLQRNSAYNLIIGIFTSAVAAILLFYLVVNQPTTVSKSSPEAEFSRLLPAIVMKLSIAGFVELFSFFFLRLYKGNQQEIKYFQNELTNIDYRAAAVDIAFKLNDKKVIGELAKTLAHTEKNGILRKGETTSQLASDQAELDHLRGLMEVMLHNNLSHLSDTRSRAQRINQGSS